MLTLPTQLEIEIFVVYGANEAFMQWMRRTGQSSLVADCAFTLLGLHPTRSGIFRKVSLTD